MRAPLFILIALRLTFPQMAGATEIEFSQCQVVKNSTSVDAECAVLFRAEDPSKPDGKQIEIHIAKFPSRSPDPERDAFTVIQGGPGMSSIDLFLSMRGIFSGIRAKRDILVIDQRGTGRSNMLSCPQNAEPTDAEFSVELTKQVAKECLEKLDSDPRYYTTSIAVQDLDAVREAAGYKQLSIYGVSYGTRVAQHYLRRFPASTRALILDGVADVKLNLAGSEIALRSQQAFDSMANRCKQRPDCNSQFGDIKLTFEALRESFKAAPIMVNLPHPVSGELTEQKLNEQYLLGLVRLMPYSTETLALLPLLLSEASKGNYVPMAAQVLQSESQFKKDYAYAMNNAVVCTEDIPFLVAADLEGDKETYIGTMMSESMRALCEVWPKGTLDADFREPYESDVPVLLMSGETDPITPAENAERSLQMFDNGLHIVVPAHGHGVVGRGCLPKLATTFIDEASIDNLKVDCVAREQAFPFFLTPVGPNP